jgi:hypothetical protein
MLPIIMAASGNRESPSFLSGRTAAACATVNGMVAG